jgi:Phage Tail Collar Domain
MSALYPIGSILPYSGQLTRDIEQTLISAGYIPCDGRELSLQDPQYSALYAQISTFYGGGGTAFFCVPDYRGRFLRGTDLGAGRDPDANARTAPNPGFSPPNSPGNTGDLVGSLQTDGVQSHTHEYASAGGDYHHIYLGLEEPGVFAENIASAPSDPNPGGGSETRPKNIYINYVIVYM